MLPTERASFFTVIIKSAPVCGMPMCGGGWVGSWVYESLWAVGRTGVCVCVCVMCVLVCLCAVCVLKCEIYRLCDINVAHTHNAGLFMLLSSLKTRHTICII